MIRKREKWDKQMHSGSTPCTINNVVVKLAPTKSAKGGYLTGIATIQPKSKIYSKKTINDPSSRAHYVVSRWGSSITEISPNRVRVEFETYEEPTFKIRHGSKKHDALLIYHKENARSATANSVLFVKKDPQ